MQKSESIVNLSKALLKAQIEMEGAKKGSNNPFFKSKYADYSSVLEACKGPLNNNGVTILQPTSLFDGQMVIETVLIHSESGEFVSAVTPIVVAKQNDPQALGSAISYSKRYGLQSLISLPSEDDDGESAMGRENYKPAQAKPVAPPKPVSIPDAVKAEVAETPKRGGFKAPVAAKAAPVQAANLSPNLSEDEWS